VRGLGPMMLIELVRDRDTKEPAAMDDTLQVVRQSVANGVIVMRAGMYSNCVRFLPPLNMPEDMLREGLGAVGRAIEQLAVPGPRFQVPSSSSSSSSRTTHELRTTN